MLYFGIIDVKPIIPKNLSKIESTFKNLTNVKTNFIHQNNLVLAYTDTTSKKSIYFDRPDSFILCLGDVFINNNQKIKDTDHMPEKIEDLGSYFVDNYWGDYILIGYDKRSKLLSLFRDPIGQSHIFYIKIDSKLIFSSDIQLIKNYLGKNANYNIAYFIYYINNSFINVNETPFEDINEIYQGCRLTYFDNCIKLNQVWDPLKHCRKNISGYDFKNKFIQETSNIIDSSISPFKKVVLEYSGGFDSTSLLYFLNSHAKDKEILTINFYDRKVNSSNETSHAKKITNELGIKLEILELNSLLPFSPIDHTLYMLPNYPTASMIFYKKESYVNAKYLDNQHKNEVIYMSGHGGDNIFMCPPIQEAIIDYFIDKGIKGLSCKLQDLCFLERDAFINLIKIFIIGYKNYLSAKIFKHKLGSITNNEQPPWLSQKADFLKEKITPHLLTTIEVKDILPGKAELLKSIMFGLSTIPKNLDGTNTFYPFFSQRLIELCLTFPTYDTFTKDYDRYHVRSLISEHFQTQNVWRKDKGETSGILQRGLVKNKKRVLELCLEGRLSSNGFLDKNLLYQNLKNLMCGYTDYQWQISNLFTSEMFIELWQSRIYEESYDFE